MNVLIEHLILNNLDEIVSKSILNCHCRGVHSIMLLDAPEKRIRLYIAESNNDMYKNMYHHITTGSITTKLFPRDDMSVGFHSHHCNLTLQCVKGEFHNWVVKEVSEKSKGFDITKWEYQSYITSGEMKFKKLCSSRLDTVEYKIIREGEYINLDAKEIHTVACHPFSLTAWLVFEGKEDPDYNSFIWSNNDLNLISTQNLYQKPTEEKIIWLLKNCNLLK